MERNRSPAVTGVERRGRIRAAAVRTTAIRVVRQFSAPPERVFDAWLDPRVAGKWLFATAWRPMASVAIDARVAGAFSLVDRHDSEEVEYAGEYIEITRPRRLVFTLSSGHETRSVTRVLVEIAPLAAGCELVLTHQNVAPDRASQTEARWTGILYGLGVTLESTVPDSTIRSALQRSTQPLKRRTQ